MTQSTILFYSSKLVAKDVQENFIMPDESSDEDYADFQTETDSDISPPSSLPSSSSSEEEEEEITPKRGGVRTRGGAAKRPKEDPTKGWSSDTFLPKALTFTGTPGLWLIFQMMLHLYKSSASWFLILFLMELSTKQTCMQIKF